MQKYFREKFHTQFQLTDGSEIIISVRQLTASQIETTTKFKARLATKIKEKRDKINNFRPKLKVHFAPFKEMYSKVARNDQDVLDISESEYESNSNSDKNSTSSKRSFKANEGDDNETQFTEQSMVEKMNEMSLSFTKE